MNDRPTPETDAFQSQEWKPNWANFARRLERERDEARAMARDMRNQLETNSIARLVFPWENTKAMIFPPCYD